MMPAIMLVLCLMRISPRGIFICNTTGKLDKILEQLKEGEIA